MTTFLSALKLIPLASARDEYFASVPMLLRGDTIRPVDQCSPRYLLNVGAIEWIVRAVLDSTKLPLIPPKEALATFQAFLETWKPELNAVSFLDYHWAAVICLRNTRRDSAIHKAALTNCGLYFDRFFNKNTMWMKLAELRIDPSMVKRIVENRISWVARAHEESRSRQKVKPRQGQKHNIDLSLPKTLRRKPGSDPPKQSSSGVFSTTPDKIMCPL